MKNKFLTVILFSISVVSVSQFAHADETQKLQWADKQYTGPALVTAQLPQVAQIPTAIEPCTGDSCPIPICDPLTGCETPAVPHATLPHTITCIDPNVCPAAIPSTPSDDNDDGEANIAADDGDSGTSNTGTDGSAGSVTAGSPVQAAPVGTAEFSGSGCSLTAFDAANGIEFGWFALTGFAVLPFLRKRKI